MLQLRRTEFMGEKLSTNVQNQNGSTQCICRLTKSIIYNIYYERKLLPDDMFITRLIEGIPVKEFAPGIQNSRVLQLNAWIGDLVRSIEKKELKSVCLELIRVDTNTLIECYNIRYSYRDESTAKKIPQQFTYNGIQTMLKNMKNIFRNKMNPLIDKRNLRFRMTADTTGMGKESSVFSVGKKRMMEFAADDDKIDMEMGAVCTPFHRLILKVTADVRQNQEDSENDVIIIEENSQKSAEPEIIELDDYPDNDEIMPSTSGSSIQASAENMETDSSKLYSTIREMSNLKISCICGTEIRDNFFTIIQCGNCSSYQHAECYGVYKIAKLPGRHLCTDCSCLWIDSFLKIRSPVTGQIISQETNTHTDARLLEYTIAELKDIGRMRLILIYIYREKKSPLHFMKTHFNRADLEKLMEKLLKYEILMEVNKKLQLNSNKVNLFIRKHFKPKYSINKYF